MLRAKFCGLAAGIIVVVAGFSFTLPLQAGDLPTCPSGWSQRINSSTSFSCSFKHAVQVPNNVAQSGEQAVRIYATRQHGLALLGAARGCKPFRLVSDSGVRVTWRGGSTARLSSSYRCSR